MLLRARCQRVAKSVFDYAPHPKIFSTCQVNSRVHSKGIASLRNAEQKSIFGPRDLESSAIEREIKEFLAYRITPISSSSENFTRPTLDNRIALEKIRALCMDRTYLRLKKPSDLWKSKHESKKLINRIQQLFNNPTVSVPKLQRAVSVGDLVLLLDLYHKLHLVVGLPPNFNSTTYTFINEDGDIIYGPRSRIILRVPGILPEDLINELDLITLETKYPKIAPSGMPDSTFSRGSFLSPLELRKWESDRSKLETSTLVKQQDSNETGIENTSAGETQSEISYYTQNENKISTYNVGDDLFIAQAASQFLVDTDINTFIIPESARKIFDRHLQDLSAKSFVLIPNYLKKLEKLYQLESDSQRPFYGVSQYTIFELFDILENKILLDLVSTTNILPFKNFGRSDIEIPVANYIALVLSLKRSQRSWRIESLKSTMDPLSVFSRRKMEFFLMEHQKDFLQEGGMNAFENFYVRFLQEKVKSNLLQKFPGILKMFQSFVADGCTNDPSMASLVATLVKQMDLHIKGKNIVTNTQSLLVQSSRSRAHEILTSLDDSMEVSPVSWLETTNVPNSEVSPDAKLTADFYKYVDSTFDVLKKNWKRLPSEFYKTDTLSGMRKNFGPTPVYCIDSETAQEIDDGISIQERKLSFLITIHIANPTSYIKKSSKLSKMAFKMGSTNYMPEDTITMLPRSLSTLCGLDFTDEEASKVNGTDSKELKPPRKKYKRTLAVQFSLRKRPIVEYFNQVSRNSTAKPSDELATKVYKDISKTVNIKAYKITNLPSNYTYETVNAILNDEENIALFKNKKLRASPIKDLFQLYHISSILRHFRVKNGGSLEISRSTSSVSVKFSDKEVCKLLEEVGSSWKLCLPRSTSPFYAVLTFTQGSNRGLDSKSQQLVSNFMIAANFAGARFAQREKVPLIYKEQSLNMSTSVKNAVDAMSREFYDRGEAASSDRQLALISVFSTASFTTVPGKHSSLGLDVYLNLTSPLRRYVDMVNHWNLELYLLRNQVLKTTRASEYPNLVHTAGHLQAAEYRNKYAQRLANRFWSCKFLGQYIKLKEEGSIQSPLTFSFLLRGDAKYGDVKASIIEFSGVHVTIVRNNYLVEQFLKNEFQIGKVVKATNLRLCSLDCVEGEISVELLEPQTRK